MPVVEYKMHRINGSNRRAVPDFIGDRGYWNNSTDNTYIGWIDENPDYYVPDTIVTLTKEEFVARQLTMHASTPMLNITENPEEEPTVMTEEEVTTVSEEWYDAFVESNS